MDPMSSLSLASAIVQFVEFASKVTTRLAEFRASGTTVPDTFESIHNLLPLLIDTLGRTRRQAESQNLNKDTADSLLRVFNGCETQIKILDATLSKILPATGDHSWRRGVKAYRSVLQESKVDHISKKLQNYIQILTYHQTTQFSDLFPIGGDGGYHYEVPSRQVSVFIGREDILSDIKCAIDTSLTKPGTIVLLGMGGQGKTQIALEFCRRARHNDHIRAIFWIDATSENTAMKSVEEISVNALRSDRKSALSQAAQVRYFKSVLEGWSQLWLLVLDNYDDPKSFPNILDYVPKGKSGSIIITTRNAGVERLGHTIEIPAMEEDEALALLLKRCKLPSSSGNTDHGLKIVRRLGCHALAVDQGAAYIRRRKMLLRDFLDNYETQKDKILKETPSFWEYRRQVKDEESETALNVFSTWEMSLALVDSDSAKQKMVEAFLTICAFLSYDRVTERLFDYISQDPGQNFEQDFNWLQLFGAPEKSLYESGEIRSLVSSLQELSLILSTGSSSDGIISLHPLVADWLKVRLSKPDRQKYTLRAVQIVQKVFEATARGPTDGYYGYNFDMLAKLRVDMVAHMQSCESNIKMNLPESEQLGVGQFQEAGEWFARFYETQGHSSHAATLRRRLYDTRLRSDGPRDLLTLKAGMNLARAYGHQGNYVMAEELMRHILDLQKDILGGEHPITLAGTTHLATVLFHQGRFEESEDLGTRVLNAQQAALGHDNPSTLASLDSLAWTIHRQGKLEEAEKLTRQALLSRRRIFGDWHEDTLQSANTLVVNLNSLGRFEEAEKIARETLASRENLLGEFHPQTITSLYNLGLTLESQGQLEIAEDLTRKVLKRRREVLGSPYHPDILSTMEHLIALLKKKKKDEEADELRVEANRLTTRYESGGGSGSGGGGGINSRRRWGGGAGRGAPDTNATCGH